MEYAILDIETTGLDLEHSSIIEVGAIIVSSGKIRDEYTSFVHFDGVLPETTKHITGISDEMLKGAPPVHEVIEKLRTFVGKHPVIAHNGFSFDFRILEREGLKFSEKYDSMEFAFFILPTSTTGHGMHSLSEQFKLGEVPHRALPDCKLEFQVLEKLQEVWDGKNKKSKEALKSLATRTDWWWQEFLSGGTQDIEDFSELVETHVPYRKKDPNQDKLALAQPIDTAQVEHFFTASGVGGQGSQYTEDRPEQRQVAKQITEAFNTKTHAVIEAGTGVGKSKSYLVPSVLFALKNGIPVTISTYTKALQDQLFVKEIPHVRETVNPNLRVAVIKGKTNYVCLDKFREFAKDVLTELTQRSLYEHAANETRFTTRLALLLLSAWVIETERGDWDELPYWLTERVPKRVMQDICNLDELCSQDVCELYDAEKCFLAKARLRAKDADLVIMNHAILLTGIRQSIQHEETIDSEEPAVETMSYSHAVLPGEAKFLVLDEAHHLEDAATSAWTKMLAQSLLERLMKYLYDERRGARRLMDEVIGDSPTGRLPALGVSFDGIEQNLKLDIQALFGNILDTLLPQNSASKWSEHLSFSELAKTPERLKPLIDLLNSIGERLRNVREILRDFAERATNEKTRKALTIRAELTGRLEGVIYKLVADDEDFVRYLERSGSIIEINAAPLSIAQDMKKLVYDNFHSVVMTSATITVGNTFNFFAHRCGTELVEKEKVHYLHCASSFDYSKQVQFFVPKGISYTSKEKMRHSEQCLEFLKEAILASQGGALVLCSSHEQVDQLYTGLYQSLSKKNIWLLRQSRQQSIGSVVRDFANDLNSVLIGTASLWQGVDVPGPSLRTLFIYKIPYAMPFDPLIVARRDEIKRTGGDDFATYYEPLAALDLKQGFGRLIRKKTDIGIAILLDDRILRKDMLLKSFPPGVKIQGADPKIIYAALETQAKSLNPEESDV